MGVAVTAVTLGVFPATPLGAPQGDLNPAVTLVETLIGIYTVPQFIVTSIVQIWAAAWVPVIAPMAGTLAAYVIATALHVF